MALHRCLGPAAALGPNLAALAVVLAVYGGVIRLWQSITGETLQLTGYRVA